MALLTASSFPDVLSAPVPTQSNATITAPHATDPVILVTSTGTWTVFDQVSTALLCMEHLRFINTTYLNLSYNIRVLSVSATKLLVLELIPPLYDLATKHVPIYQGGAVLFIDRKSGISRTLSQVLQVVGVVPSYPIAANNYTLRKLGVPLLLVDVNYQSNAVDYAGTQSADVAPLVYTYTIPGGLNANVVRWTNPPVVPISLLTTADDYGSILNASTAFAASWTVAYRWQYSSTVTSQGWVNIALPGKTFTSAGPNVFFRSSGAGYYLGTGIQIEFLTGPNQFPGNAARQWFAQTTLPANQDIYFLETFNSLTGVGSFTIALFQNGAWVLPSPIPNTDGYPGTNPGTVSSLAASAGGVSTLSLSATQSTFGYLVIANSVLTLAQAFAPLGTSYVP